MGFGSITDVNDGEWLRGLSSKDSFTKILTSVICAKSGTVRFVEGRYSLKNIPGFAAND